MKLVSISIIRNEADIIETFIRYHLQFVDLMIIVNHRSADSSMTILNALKSEGLNIEIAEEYSLYQPQADVLTRMMKKAVNKYQADWVLPLDADEFLTAHDNLKVRDVLERSGKDKIIKVAWKTYIPTEKDNKNEKNILKRIQYSKASEATPFFKVIIPKEIANNNAEIKFGSHDVKKRSLFKGNRKFPVAEANNISLAHFPVRSSNQIISKSFVGWLACLARPDKGRKDNFHLKQLFDRFIVGDQLNFSELSNIAYTYGEKGSVEENERELLHSPLLPEGHDYELKYQSESIVNPLQILATMAEEFADALSRCRS